MKLNVLIIDDDQEIGLLIKNYLTKEGFDAIYAPDGKAGINYFETSDISIVILDLMLPDTDGLEICRKIREKSNIPIIMLTAKESSSDKIIGLGIGADDYITKPFDINELVARIKAQVRRCYNLNTETKENTNKIVFPGFLIDKNKYRLIINEREIKLTSLEFNLLFFLAQNPGRVYTRKQIIESVWDEEIYIDDNTLSVHIKRLRDKIEINPEKMEIIQTIRNIGYKFNEEISGHE